MYLGKKSPILKATPCWWSEWLEKFLAHLIFTGIYWCHTNATQCNRGDCIATGWSKTLYCLHTRCMYVRMYTYIHHVRWPFLWGWSKMLKMFELLLKNQCCKVQTLKYLKASLDSVTFLLFNTAGGWNHFLRQTVVFQRMSTFNLLTYRLLTASEG